MTNTDNRIDYWYPFTMIKDHRVIFSWTSTGHRTNGGKC